MNAPAAGTPVEIGGLNPPPGVTPNFTDPYSIANSLIAGSALCLALATITTAIRLYTKAFIIKSFGLEDYTMFLAWGGFVAYFSLGLGDLKYGAGVHQWDVPITKLVHFAQRGNIPEILYPPLIAATKLSICLQIMHIFVVGRSKSFWTIQVFIWVNMLYYAVCFFITIFQCLPRAKIWNPGLPGTCVDYHSLILVTAVFNCVSDLLMLLFPLACISRLQMSTKRKVGLSAVFFVGTLALAASLMRIIFSAINNKSRDETFQLSRVAECTSGEISAGIVAGNLVVSPRFFAIYNSKLSSFFASFRSGRASELLDDGTPANNMHSRPKTWKARPSGTWLAQHTAGTISADCMELNHQEHNDPATTSHQSHINHAGNTVGENLDLDQHIF